MATEDENKHDPDEILNNVLEHETAAEVKYDICAGNSRHFTSLNSKDVKGGCVWSLQKGVGSSWMRGKY